MNSIDHGTIFNVLTSTLSALALLLLAWMHHRFTELRSDVDAVETRHDRELGDIESGVRDKVAAIYAHLEQNHARKDTLTTAIAAQSQSSGQISARLDTIIDGQADMRERIARIEAALEKSS